MVTMHHQPYFNILNFKYIFFLVTQFYPTVEKIILVSRKTFCPLYLNPTTLGIYFITSLHYLLNLETETSCEFGTSTSKQNQLFIDIFVRSG